MIPDLPPAWGRIRTPHVRRGHRGRVHRERVQLHRRRAVARM